LGVEGVKEPAEQRIQSHRWKSGGTHTGGKRSNAAFRSSSRIVNYRTLAILDLVTSLQLLTLTLFTLDFPSFFGFFQSCCLFPAAALVVIQQHISFSFYSVLVPHFSFCDPAALLVRAMGGQSGRWKGL
jgi:hypothetical protein